jgi:hypothetical protein
MGYYIILEVDCILRQEYFDNFDLFYKVVMNNESISDEDLEKFPDNIRNDIIKYNDIWVSLDIKNIYEFKLVENNILKIRLETKPYKHDGDLKYDYIYFVQNIIVPITSYIIECDISQDDYGLETSFYTDEELRNITYTNNFTFNKNYQYYKEEKFDYHFRYITFLDDNILVPCLLKNLKTSNRLILEGVTDVECKEVVIKISDDKLLTNEFDMFKILKKNNISGILQYICYFECNNNYKNIYEKIKKYGKINNIVNNYGDTMFVLVMKYIRNKNFLFYDWKINDLNKIKSCLKQVICTSLDAYLKIGFVHKDLHFNNILIKKTILPGIVYNIDNNNIVINIPTDGYKILLMDFEYSSINNSVFEFFKDYNFNFLNRYDQFCEDTLQKYNVNPNNIKKFKNHIKELYENIKNEETNKSLIDLNPDPSYPNHQDPNHIKYALKILELLPIIDEF